MKFFVSFLLLCFCLVLNSVQAQDKPRNFIKLVGPVKETLTVTSSRFYVVGQTAAGSLLMLDTAKLKVYTTGAFAQVVALNEGISTLKLTSILDKDTVTKTITVTYTKPLPPKSTEGFAIEYVRLVPNEDQWLQPGDRLQVVMKASPGMTGSFLKGISMTEIDSAEVGVKGIYRGEYLIKQGDTIAASAVEFKLNNTKNIISANTVRKLTILSGERTLIGLTTGERPGLDYGLGADRLGGAKLGYLDTLVQLNITGRFGDSYRVKLAEGQQAYITRQNVKLLNGVHFVPVSLTANMNESADGQYDYLAIGLDKRLPYSSTAQIEHNRIVVKIYGASSNTNWLVQKSAMQEIKNVWYDQVSKDVLQISIDLNHAQLWGYDVYYRGNTLIIKVKHVPNNLDISKLTIGIDAGHGGSNVGADGITGSLERNITLSMALKLKAELEKLGTKVIMTRTNDTSFSNPARLKFMKLQNPDLLVSIHCNSSENPMAQGNSTYYKHVAFRPLSQLIHDEILKMGMADFGNVGSFNFFFSSPTEYPNVLVETAFLSNPEDEEHIIQDGFQQQMVDAIVKGIKTFLQKQMPEVAITPTPVTETSSPKKKGKHADQ